MIKIFLPKEQKECCRGSKGCKDQLLISKAKLQECKSKKQLEYGIDLLSETFDRVPYSWIIKPLELIGVNNKVILFAKKIMSYWRTCVRLRAGNKLIETEDIKIHCGIFQGDSLSPLLFCICLIPLTGRLNRLSTVYEEHTTETKISHLLYMDDLKLIAKSEEELQKEIQTVKTFSDDIHMKFDLKNVPRLHLREVN
jgi:hypothetical protein